MHLGISHDIITHAHPTFWGDSARSELGKILAESEQASDLVAWTRYLMNELWLDESAALKKVLAICSAYNERNRESAYTLDTIEF